MWAHRLLGSGLWLDTYRDLLLGKDKGLVQIGGYNKGIQRTALRAAADARRWTIETSVLRDQATGDYAGKDVDPCPSPSPRPHTLVLTYDVTRHRVLS